MKKILLSILILFSGLTTALYAQSIVQVGVKGGLLINKSNLEIYNTGSKINYSHNSTKPGFEVGLQFRVELPLGFMIQPEVVYSRVNGKFPIGDKNVSGATANDEMNIRSNWIDVPVLLGWKFSIVRIMAGPSFRFPMSEVVDAKNVNTKIAPRLDNFVMGYQVGVGVDLGRFTLDARYCGNFTNITDDGVIHHSSNTSDLSNMNINEQKFSLSVGYMILK